MAKTRIYELARSLSIENRTLLEKLEDMNIIIKSHMSSLDDEVVARIKANLLGTKADVVEVTRVKPTVIRRRKKVVQVDEILESTSPDQTGPPEKIAPVEQPPEKVFKKKELLEEAVATEEIETKKDVPEQVDEKIKVAERSIPEKVKESKAPAIKEEYKPKPEKTLRKAKKEATAKIIKMPTAPKEEEAGVEKPEVKRMPAPEKAAKESRAPQKHLDIKKEKKKRSVAGREEVAAKDEKPSGVKWVKKKISFRRKEVVEGKDLYSKRRFGQKVRKGVKSKTLQEQKPQITTPKAIKRRIKIDDAIVLSDLAKRMGIKAAEMIKEMMALGVMATVNQTIDFDTATLVAAEFNYELEKASFEEAAVLKIEKDDPDRMTKRPSVVTIMGHVDHGKTSLLDAIRKTREVDNEAGGITQHIGAYDVSTDKGRIVFLDTPGHEAFTAMRARGAEITDLVVLVVAADDGVMPQTIEAINHSKAAKVPIIVAINKIDKDNADPERVQRELAEIGLVPEEWGGDTIFLKISAKNRLGIDELLEMILLQAEVLELVADPERLATGRAIEARTDPGRGVVVTVLVQNGTLHIGDSLICGIYCGKVRSMLNDRGVYLKTAGPSTPVEIIGLSGVPKAGDEMIAFADDKSARQVSIHRIQKQRSKDLAKTSRLSLEGLFEQMQEGEVKELNLIIRADVDGSLEAIEDSLAKLSGNKVNINVIHSATGTITESDVSLATVSDATIIGFNVRPNLKVQSYANREDVNLRFYNIIYDLIREIKEAIIGMMSSTFKERILGRAEVREVFHIPKVGTIAGCYVTSGKIGRGQLVHLLRDGVVCYDGKVSSLRRFKDDAKEVQSGYECGIGIENYNDIKVSDTIECYYLEETKPKL